MGTSGISECYSLDANTLQKHRWFFNCKSTSEDWYSTHLYARSLEFADKLPAINLWLSIEDRYDLIMDNAEPDNEYVIDAYGKKLFSMYPDRCLKVLANAADRQARTSKNRRDYKYIARTLKKIATRPGGRELAAELAAKFRAQYPRRSAMIDELKRF